MDKLTLALLILVLGIASVGPSSFAAEKKWSDEGELSLVKTGGNTQVTSLATKNQLKYQFNKDLLGVWKLGALYGESDHVRNAESYFTDLRLDYQVTKRAYAFPGAGWKKDDFAGIYRRLYGGGGGGYKFLNGPKHFLVGEVGLNYVADTYTDDTTENYPAGRVYGKYTFAITKKNTLSQSVGLLYDFNDSKKYEVNTETAVQSALNDHLSMKAAYVVDYRNEPVPSSLKKTDTQLTVALVVTY